MGLFDVIYISEAIIALLTLIVSFIIFRLKHKKGFLKFLTISIATFFVLFIITFILERPEIDIDNIDSIEVNSAPIMPKINSKYHFKDITERVNVKGNVDFNKVGEYDIQIEVNTIIGIYKKEAKISIVDTIKPEITLEAGEEYKQSYSKEFEEPGYKAIDNYDGDITDKVIVTKENTDDTNFILKYEITDSSGNKNEKARKVSIVDDISPQITLNGNANIEITLNGNYEEQGARATDEKDGDLTDKIIKEGSVDTSKEGNYKITYKVVDSNGNESIETRNV